MHELSILFGAQMSYRKLLGMFVNDLDKERVEGEIGEGRKIY